MHYKQIVEEILAFAGQGTGGQAETLVKRMVNTVYFRVLEEVDTSYEDRVFTASSISDQATLGMPLSVRKILNIEDPTTPRMLSVKRLLGVLIEEKQVLRIQELRMSSLLLKLEAHKNIPLQMEQLL